MKFNEYTYEHMDKKEIQKKIEGFQHRLETADSYAQFKAAFDEMDTYDQALESNVTLCQIRHSINTKDPFYQQENDYWDQVLPEIQSNFHQTDAAILHSHYCEQLKKDVPITYFLSKEMDQQTFSDAIIPELQKENELSSKYQALIASSQIEFNGKVYTLSQLEPLMTSKDRKVRKGATKAYWGWFNEHQDDLNKLYDQLVKTRDTMAKKLGYKNYIELGYKRMYRYDYNQEDVAGYRKQILDVVVPIAQQLYKRQAKRLGVDKLYTWDEKVEFKEGNPTPIQDIDGLCQSALQMYQELSPSTGSFFQFMLDHDLMDLEAKPNKAPGGYCTYIPAYQSPFIFANGNHTDQDVETLTHEAGHAYQVYCSKDIRPSECIWPTYESCEIHSMSMEFFTHPWMEHFFGDKADAYRFAHVSGAVKFLPYGVLVDHFQHEVYAHPQWSPLRRMDCWRKLEKQYLPQKNYDEIPFLENGGWWMRQLHIFMDPFYYIDYTLAQVCALEFWCRKDEQVFKDYRHLCSLGGTLPFRQLVKEAGLIVPFDPGCLEKTMKPVCAWLENSNY
ncbi:M3 family oligoendopeptidase [Absicoccus porci]|uniref:M3 family oligoendopeptidase n=1 Tax=Absicoccus porci TaxID=2486576 RepID=UPI002943B707|nr:M3 family oligoendopeptidase [Absicoccus porci]